MKTLILLGILSAPLWGQAGDKAAAINADLLAARTANKELRFADAEALMLPRNPGRHPPRRVLRPG